MKQNWHIWTIFLSCLVVVVVAMSWLSVVVVQLDNLRESDRAETELARREAELQERISSALYRMDWLMLPLVSLEATRSLESFRSKDATPGALGECPLVRFRFQVDASGQWTSPELPSPVSHQKIANRSEDLVSSPVSADIQLQQAKQIFDFEQLMVHCNANRASLGDASSQIAARDQPADFVYGPAANGLFQAQIQNQSPRPPSLAISGINKIDVQRSRSIERVNQEFSNRYESTQNIAVQNLIIEPNGNGVVEVMQPMWIENQLLLARQVNLEGQSAIQCCWLDWEAIRELLRSETEALLPHFDFEPLASETELKIGTALTTLPVQLLIDRPKMLASLALPPMTESTASGIRLALVAAWVGLAVAAIAVALMLNGVIRLSDRRAAFVSSVTHELRTPLTTFRMYAEMFAEGMVPQKKQAEYAQTLKVQADRLSHLVENVLQFARLERGPGQIVDETMTVEELLERFAVRLSERASDVDMRLTLELEEAAAASIITTQPVAVEQILFNLVDNACKYAQSAEDRRVIVSANLQGSNIQFRVRDFGPGITHEERASLFQPFRQSDQAQRIQAPGVGLGLALSRRLAHSIGGSLESEPSDKGALFLLEIPARTGGKSN